MIQHLPPPKKISNLKQILTSGCKSGNEGKYAMYKNIKPQTGCSTRHPSVAVTFMFLLLFLIDNEGIVYKYSPPLNQPAKPVVMCTVVPILHSF